MIESARNEACQLEVAVVEGVHSPREKVPLNEPEVRPVGHEFRGGVQGPRV